MVRFRPHREVGEQQHPYLAFVENAVLNGQALTRVGWNLEAQGYSPDLVVAHSGWGPGFYVREVCPGAKHLGYFQWYYRSKGADLGHLNNVTRDGEFRITTRNAAILLDLAACNWGTDVHEARLQAGASDVSIAPADGGAGVWYHFAKSSVNENEQS